jgi:hypothetical protein
VGDVALVVPHQRTFGEHIRTLARRYATQRLADDGFRPAEAVGGRRVDPIDAPGDRAPDGGNRVRIVLRAPPETPGAADRPGPEADAGDVEGGLTQLSRLHSVIIKAKG